MYAGTLLGSYRYHDLIPWDDDVDLLVPTSEQAAVRAALVPLEPDFRLHTTNIHMSCEYFKVVSHIHNGVCTTADYCIGLSAAICLSAP